jgi:catechol 2,3-dioxygenase-like lactoylglutathione lyase family enzyme
MTVTGIHHFNLRVSAKELDKLQAFYCGVLGLCVGARPSFQSIGVWLYAGETPLIHLTQMHSGEVVAPGSPQSLPDVQARQSAIDHIAFASEDLNGAIQRLTGHAVTYTRTEVPATGEIQLFFRDPSGNGIELIFPMSLEG